MKKKCLFLLTIPALCLFSCNKATKIVYRDNFTKRDVYSDGYLTSSTTSTYDEYGLPLEIKQVVNPVWGSNLQPKVTIKTYNRAFDDKHREIKLEEKVTISTINEIAKPYGDYQPSDTTTITTREYDDSGFLVKENFKKLVNDGITLTETTSSTRIAHKVTKKNGDGYLIFTLLVGRASPTPLASNARRKNTDVQIADLSVISYDKQDRKTGSFNLSTIKSANSISSENSTASKIMYSSTALVLTNINYQSDDNDSNDFYEYTYRELKSSTNANSSYGYETQSLMSGYEAYSDKNLLIKRHVEKSDDNMNKLTLSNLDHNYYNYTDETWQYDDFNRFISYESKETTYDGEEIAGQDNIKIDYSYANTNDQEPSKVVYKSETKNKEDATTMTKEGTELAEFDDYGRVKTFSSEETIKETYENKEPIIIKTSNSIVSDYADPIAIPEGEVLISIPQTESVK
ncbi:MAG: hypothetical protein MJ208_02270 [Bacilli bacterium]|nr:hypothetical protein [Bacilli bacterium]